VRSENRLDDEPATSSFRKISFWKKKNNCFSEFLVFFSFQSKMNTPATAWRKKKRVLQEISILFLLSEKLSQKNFRSSRSSLFDPTYFYQRELEVVVGASHLPDNNFSLEEQKQAFL
jgi:hypothetical protein